MAPVEARVNQALVEAPRLNFRNTRRVSADVK